MILCPILGGGTKRYEADALARQRKIFGVGACDKRIGVVQKNARDAAVVVNDLPVGLIGDQVNYMAEQAAFCLENLPQPRDGLLRIHLAGRVVRRINEHDLGARTDLFLHAVQVEIEVRIECGHGFEHPAVIVRIKPVFHEIGGRAEHFVTGIEQRLENYVEAARSPACYDYLLVCQGDAELLAKIGGHGRAGGKKARVWHICVHSRLFTFDQLDEFFANYVRRRNIRVSQAEIEDFVLPMDFFQARALFEHLANPRGFFHKLAHLFGNRHIVFETSPQIENKSRFSGCLLRSNLWHYKRDLRSYASILSV